jgi:hypothetical protein
MVALVSRLRLSGRKQRHHTSRHLGDQWDLPGPAPPTGPRRAFLAKETPRLTNPTSRALQEHFSSRAQLLYRGVQYPDR